MILTRDAARPCLSYRIELGMMKKNFRDEGRFLDIFTGWYDLTPGKRLPHKSSIYFGCFLYFFKTIWPRHRRGGPIAFRVSSNLKLTWYTSLSIEITRLEVASPG